MSVMTLTEFLLARIAEDEYAARRAASVSAAEWVASGSVLMYIADPGPRLADELGTVEYYEMDDAWRHAERHDPGRVLAECQAKREIIGILAPGWPVDDDRYTLGWQDAATFALRHLAAVYADHPDYDKAWRL